MTLLFSQVSLLTIHVTSRQPYWCSKTMKWRPCTKPSLWELNSFLTVCTKHFLLFQYFVELLAAWVKTLYSLLFACLLANFLAATYSPCYSPFVPFSNDSNVTDQDGNTPLHLAAISSKTECMRVLLRAGATDSLSLGMLIVHLTAFFPCYLLNSCRKEYPRW